MQSISLFVELLRTRPRLLLWTMAVLQAVPWTLVPLLFYTAPPGQLPLVLAIGHEFQVDTELGPPLAFWLAEIAYRSGGMFGVYLLSQICIVATFWAVFSLGRAMVGAPHAAIAVMLMAGIAVFSVPTPEFGPGILATPLWALMLAHYWLGAERGTWPYWVALGVEAGLLLLTTYAGAILIGLLALYTVATAHGRAQIETIGPWLAGIAMTVVLFPYLIWLDLGAGIGLPNIAAILDNLRIWGWIVVALLLSHVGMAILILIGRGALVGSRDAPPEIVRTPVASTAPGYVYFFAFTPLLGMGLLALFTSRSENLIAAPLVVLSGLAVVIAAGDRIKIAHQHLIGYAWVALLLLPPVLLAFAVMVQPWTFAADLRVSRPADDLGQFFGDSFARRTGKPLEVVAGDHDLAALVAASAPSRPSLYRESASPERLRAIRQDIAEKGAVVLWPATDPQGRPPREVQQQFPDLVTEVPRAFDRRFQGRMPLMRIGWGMIRPRAEPVSAPPPRVQPAPLPEPPPPVETRPEPPPLSRPQAPPPRPAPPLQAEPAPQAEPPPQPAAPAPAPRRSRQQDLEIRRHAPQ